MKVRELMTTDVITVGPDFPLKEAARRMLDAGVSGLPVTDDSGELVGIITEADFVAGEADRRTKQRAGLLRFLVNRQEIPTEERKVGDVMTPEVVTVSPDIDHAEAARIMERENVKRLPVVDGGRLVGLLARADMLRAFTRGDQEIIDEINDHVISRVLWLDPSKVKVVSVDGNVTLSGRLEHRTDVALLLELTKRLDGVASVTDDLSWEYDNTKGDDSSPRPGIPRPNW
jgi:CBS-domain-containing membrane protein